MDVNDGKEESYNSEDFAFMRKTASGEDNDNMDGNRGKRRMPARKRMARRKQ